MSSPERQWRDLHAHFMTAWMRKQPPESLALAHEELAFSTETFGSSHPYRINAWRDLALAQRLNGDETAAAAAEGEALALAETLAQAAEREPEAAATALWLRWQADQWSNIPETQTQAMAAYHRALTIRERLAAPDPIELADLFARVGELHFVRGDWDEAERSYHRALSLYARADSDSDALFHYKTLETLGQLMANAGRETEALPLFEKARALIDRPGADRKDLYYLLIHYAEALAHAGRTAESEQLRRRADELLPKTNPGAAGYNPGSL